MSRDDLDLSFDSSQDDSDALRLQGEAEAMPSTESAEEGKPSTAGEVLFDGLGSPDDAGDFLGLDTELHFSNDSSGGGTIDTGLGQASASESMMELESAPGSEIAPEELGEFDDEEEALFPDGEHLAELEEDEFQQEDEGGGPHKGVLVLAAFGIGALVVIGAVFGPGLLDKTTGETPIDVANTTTTDAAVDPGAANTNSAATNTTTEDPSLGTGTTADSTALDSGADPFFASADGVVTPPVKNGEGGSLERLFSSGAFDMVPREVTPGSGTGSTSTVDLGPAIVTTAPDAGIGNTGMPNDPSNISIGAPIQLPTSSGSDAASSTAAFFGAGLDWASAGDIDIVWRRNEVPMDAIDAPTRVATPNVGTVRVHLIEGDFFEGKLVAVGEGHVWIQTTPGRMAFAGTIIESIEALGMELAATDPGAVNAPKRGERIRVYAPGGIIYGHVVSRNEDGGVTLRTDEGGKVTIASAKIEAIGNSRAVIVQD